MESSVAGEFLPRVAKQLTDKGCELIVDETAGSILEDYPTRPASEKDFAEEFLDLRLSIKVVNSLDEAIAFINAYGSGTANLSLPATSGQKPFSMQWMLHQHTECKHPLADGFEFGLGAKLASPPTGCMREVMGLEELCTYKYQITGNGQWKK